MIGEPQPAARDLRYLVSAFKIINDLERVGDLAMNKFPLRLSPGLPVLGDDLAAVLSSWKALLELGATTVYPAHGKPFSADVIKEAISAAA